MTAEQLNRLLALLKRTNDTAIVLDPDSDELFALLPVARYEALRAGRQALSPPATSHPPPAPDEFPAVPHLAAGAETDAPEPWEEILPPPPLPPSASEPLSFTPDWATHNTPAAGEENLADVPAEEEEEKFYLEPVE